MSPANETLILTFNFTLAGARRPPASAAAVRSVLP